MRSLPNHSSLDKPLLLLVDDDPLICDGLSLALSGRFEVVTSHARASCLQLLRQLRRAPDLALIDLGLPPLPHRPDEGFALIAELLRLSPGMRIVVLSGQSDEGNARHARTLGAAEFVGKPCHPAELQQVLERALAFQSLAGAGGAGDAVSPLIGNSPAIQKLWVQLRQYAELPFPVLIEGESGSGKEIIAARCLHHDTRRRNRPFLALNCAAISPNLVEATLFGYARGAFTGAVTSKPGYFEDAGEGTLFLDEIGELPLDVQAKLLRVLENGDYQRLGETQRRVSQARIIAATNRDLRKEVKSGSFRADLYHRLSVCSISAPPLREMGDDKIVLLDHFRRVYAEQAQQEAFTLSEQATTRWLDYDFPGNVRELRNIVIRLTSKYAGQVVDLARLESELDLPDEPLASGLPPSSASGETASEAIVAAATQRLRQREPFSLDRLLAATERGYIEAALKLAHGNVSQAARLLGLHRTTLYNRMESSAREG